MKEDYEKNNNYEFAHTWLRKVNKYLSLEFSMETIEQDKEGYYQIISNKEAHFVFGALHDDKIVGSSSLEIDLFRPKVKHVGSWGIAIHPDFHNQGLGRKLITVMEDKAKEKGIKKLEAEYFEGNDKAQRLYLEKLNYEVEGRRKYSGILKDGKYVDRILIGKIIDDSITK